MSLRVNVLRSLGGSGGTIVAKALAGFGAYVFSEVNPRSATILGFVLNPLVQMLARSPDRVSPFWRQVDPNALGAVDTFRAFMRDAMEGLAAEGTPVVVRDHSYVDYVGKPFHWEMGGGSSLDAALRPLGEVHDLVLVRHPVATFRSLRRHPHYFWCLDGPAFVQGSLRFLEATAAAPRLHYETFLAAPDQELRRACGVFAIPFRNDWADRLGEDRVATGHPRALASAEVAGPTDQGSGEDWEAHVRELARDPGFDRLLALAGYRGPDDVTPAPG